MTSLSKLNGTFTATFLNSGMTRRSVMRLYFIALAVMMVLSTGVWGKRSSAPPILIWKLINLAVGSQVSWVEPCAVSTSRYWISRVRDFASSRTRHDWVWCRENPLHELTVAFLALVSSIVVFHLAYGFEKKSSKSAGSACQCIWSLKGVLLKRLSSPGCSRWKSKYNTARILN